MEPDRFRLCRAGLELERCLFPMLLDRPIDAVDLDVGIEHPVVAPTIDVPIAIQTSIKAVLVNRSAWRFGD